MVVDTPATEEEQNQIKEAVMEELDANSIEIVSISTHTGNYDFAVSFNELESRRIRSGEASVLYHPDKQDWEVNVENLGYWRS